MSIVNMIFSLKKLLSSDEYVTEKTRKKYEDLTDPFYSLLPAPKFDERKSKYRGKN